MRIHIGQRVEQVLNFQHTETTRHAGHYDGLMEQGALAPQGHGGCLVNRIGGRHAHGRRKLLLQQEHQGAPEIHLTAVGAAEHLHKPLAGHQPCKGAIRLHHHHTGNTGIGAEQRVHLPARHIQHHRSLYRLQLPYQGRWRSAEFRRLVRTHRHLHPSRCAGYAGIGPGCPAAAGSSAGRSAHRPLAARW